LQCKTPSGFSSDYRKSWKGCQGKVLISMQ
jgi:hypothetical protein